jgi:hypothetical protein
MESDLRNFSLHLDAGYARIRWHNDAKMRTTLTIDDDLFDRLRQEAARTRRRFRDVLNERLRLGLAVGGKPRKDAPKFKVEPFATKGFAPGVDEKKLNQLFDELESEGAAR